MAQLRVVPCTYQRGKARYSIIKDGTVPEVAQYRNNLVGLHHSAQLGGEVTRFHYGLDGYVTARESPFCCISG